MKYLHDNYSRGDVRTKYQPYKSLVAFLLCVCLSSAWAVPHYSDEDLKSKALKTIDLGTTEKNYEQEVLDRQAIQYDVGLLRYALSHAYPGRHTIDASIMQRVDQDLEHFASQAQPMTRRALEKALKGLIDPLPDAHLNVSASYPTLVSMQKRLQGGSNDSEPSSSAPKMTVDQVGSIRSFYAGGDQQKRVVVAKINYFPYHEAPGAKDSFTLFYEKLAGQLQGSYAFVLDLRSNPGGDSSMASPLISMLLGDHQQSNYLGEKLIDTSSGSMALREFDWNYVMYTPLWQENLGRAKALGNEAVLTCVKISGDFKHCSEASSYYQQVKKDLWKLVPTQHQAFVYADALPQSYDRMVYILQDHHTASSAELVISQLKADYPYVVTLGESTGGYIHFGDMVRLFLPKTKIYAYLPTAIFTEYPALEDKRGIPPQVYVPEGEDALKVAVRMIASFGQEKPDFVAHTKKMSEEGSDK